MPCSGLYPFSIKRCSTTQEPNVLQLEVRRLQKIVEFTQASPCEQKFREMCSRVTSKLNGFQPLILVNSNAPNATRSQAHGVYMVQDVLALCCNPLSECADDDGCSSHTPYSVQECCSNCESTYLKCYDHLDSKSGDTFYWKYHTFFSALQSCDLQCILYFCRFFLIFLSEIDVTIPSVKKLIKNLISKLCSSENCKANPPCWGFDGAKWNAWWTQDLAVFLKFCRASSECGRIHLIWVQGWGLNIGGLNK